MRQEWVGGGAPSPGGFNGIGAKLVVLASSVCWVLGNLPRLYRVTGHLPLGGLSLASLASVPTSQVNKKCTSSAEAGISLKKYLFRALE